MCLQTESAWKQPENVTVKSDEASEHGKGKEGQLHISY